MKSHRSDVVLTPEQWQSLLRRLLVRDFYRCQCSGECGRRHDNWNILGNVCRVPHEGRICRNLLEPWRWLPGSVDEAPPVGYAPAEIGRLLPARRPAAGKARVLEGFDGWWHLLCRDCHERADADGYRAARDGVAGQLALTLF